jgi:hypothetical protein
MAIFLQASGYVEQQYQRTKANSRAGHATHLSISDAGEYSLSFREFSGFRHETNRRHSRTGRATKNHSPCSCSAGTGYITGVYSFSWPFILLIFVLSIFLPDLCCVWRLRRPALHLHKLWETHLCRQRSTKFMHPGRNFVAGGVGLPMSRLYAETWTPSGKATYYCATTTKI